MADTAKRSVAKALSWRAIGTIVSLAIALVITGNLGVAASLVIVSATTKTVLYFFHERGWNWIKWGRAPGKVIWFTGLPGSGKTTITKALEKKLFTQGKEVFLLDSYEVRKVFPKVDYSKEERMDNTKRVGRLAKMMAARGTIVLCAFVSPYQEARDRIRSRCGKDFIEVFVDCPLEECMKRDPRGSYAEALAGKIMNYTGVNSPYEAPENPELILKTNEHSAEECVARVLKYLAKR